MRFAVVLLALQMLEPASPEGPIITNPAGLGSTALVEFAPASARGMPSACGTTAPTGTKGEVLTFARASVASCTKGGNGLRLTGIANGDVVSVTNNVARVEFDSDGVLALKTEANSTNFCLRSDAIDNAAWVKEQDAAPRTPTVTADYTTAPDGTATADRAQFVATSAAQYSDLYQTWTAASATDPATCSAYVLGNANSDTTDICAYNGSAWSCSACAFVTGSWNRCVRIVAGAGSTTRFCKLGNNSNQNGGIARNAADVSTWCLQGESKDHPTACMNTTAASATRATEFTPQLALPVSPGTTGCMAVSFTPAVTGGLVGALGLAGNARPIYSVGANVLFFDGTNNPSLAAGGVTAPHGARVAESCCRTSPT
jgi:hypothetical protein